MELRIRDEHAVLVEGPDGADTARDVGLDEELTAALDEWARVAATVGDGTDGRTYKVASMVSRRGRQLAGRVADTCGQPVRYTDPVSGQHAVVRPAGRGSAASVAETLIGTRSRADDPVPWLTGLTVALFTAIVVAVAILALAGTLVSAVSGWLAVLATLVASAGLAPSLWLGRTHLIARWVVFGATCGIAFSWIGLLAVLL